MARQKLFQILEKEKPVVEKRIEKRIDEQPGTIDYKFIERELQKLAEKIADYLGEDEEVVMEITYEINSCGQVCGERLYYRIGKGYVVYEDREPIYCWTLATPAEEEYDEYNWTGVWDFRMQYWVEELPEEEEEEEEY